MKEIRIWLYAISQNDLKQSVPLYRSRDPTVGHEMLRAVNKCVIIIIYQSAEDSQRTKLGIVFNVIPNSKLQLHCINLIPLKQLYLKCSGPKKVKIAFYLKMPLQIIFIWQ